MVAMSSQSHNWRSSVISRVDETTNFLRWGFSVILGAYCLVCLHALALTDHGVKNNVFLITACCLQITGALGGPHSVVLSSGGGAGRSRSRSRARFATVQEPSH